MGHCRGGEADGLQRLVQSKMPNTAGGPQSVESLLELHGHGYSSCRFQYPVAWTSLDKHFLVDFAL